MDPINNICLIIDLEGFHLKKDSPLKGSKFIVRELGYCGFPGKPSDVGVLHYTPPIKDKFLSVENLRTVRYVSWNINGLHFYPRPEENARPYFRMKKDIYQIYEKYKSGTRCVVAYKGGQIERDLLCDMNIPSINLEDYGCPRFDHLQRLATVAGCGNHINAVITHCPKVECYHFMQWLLRFLKKPFDQNVCNMERYDRMMTLDSE